MALFKKKEEAPKTDSSDSLEALPDELPSLAEEVVEAKEGKEPEGKKEAPAEKGSEEKGEKEPSSEDDLSLPDIDFETKELEQPPEKPPAEGTTEKEKKDETPLSESFFTNIYERLRQNEEMSAEILEDMKRYWESRMEPKEYKMPSLIEVEKKIQEKVEMLKRLEKEWVEKKQNLEKLKVKIAINEAEMNVQTQELRELIREQHRLLEVQNHASATAAERETSGVRMEKNESAEEKKRETKEESRSPFMEAEPSTAFVLEDGSRIYSLPQLASFLAKIDKETYDRYAKPVNNFAKWVRDVFKQENLANELKKAPAPLEAAKLVLKALSS